MRISLPEFFGFSEADVRTLNTIISKHMMTHNSPDPTSKLRQILDEAKAAFPDKEEGVAFVVGMGIAVGLERRRVINTRLNMMLSQMDDSTPKGSGDPLMDALMAMASRVAPSKESIDDLDIPDEIKAQIKEMMKDNNLNS